MNDEYVTENALKLSKIRIIWQTNLILLIPFTKLLHTFYEIQGFALHTRKSRVIGYRIFSVYFVKEFLVWMYEKECECKNIEA